MIGISRRWWRTASCARKPAIPEAIKKAYYIAASGRRGPWWWICPKMCRTQRSSPTSIPGVRFPALLQSDQGRATRARSSVAAKMLAEARSRCCMSVAGCHPTRQRIRW